MTSYTPIWRYMDFFKLQTILRDNELYLPTVDSFRNSDPNEGKFFDEYVRVQARAKNLIYKDKKTAKKELNEHCNMLKAVRHHSFVSCWTYQNESKRMWESFTSSSRIGVAVRSNILAVSTLIQEGIKKISHEHGFLFREGKITYDRELSHQRLDLENHDDYFIPIFSLSGKDKGSFKHESEYRFVACHYEGAIWESMNRLGEEAKANALHDARYSRPIRNGIVIDIKPRELVLEVRMRPNSTYKSYKKVADLMENAGFKNGPSRSTLK